MILDTSRDYSGAVLEISLNGSEKWALLNSGANPSVVDSQSLRSIRAHYGTNPGRVYEVGAKPVAILGSTEIIVNIGLRHTFWSSTARSLLSS